MMLEKDSAETLRKQSVSHYANKEYVMSIDKSSPSVPSSTRRQFLQLSGAAAGAVFLSTSLGGLLSGVAQAAEGKLVFWSQLAGSKKAAGDSLEAAFRSAYPGITLDSNLFGDPVQLHQKLLTAISSNTAPDLFVQHWDYSLAYAYGDKLLKLDGAIEGLDLVQDVDPTLLAYSAIGDDHYSVPLYGTSRGFAFNRDYVKEAGLDAGKPPRNWQELRDWAIKLTKRNSRGELEVAGFNPFNNDEAAWSLFLLLLQGAGGSLLSQDLKKPTFAGPEGVKALQFIYDLIHVDRVSDVGFGVGGTGTNHIFNQKRAASYVAGNYSINHAVNAGIDLGISGFPKEQDGFTSFVDPFSFAVPASATNRPAALTFIQFALSLDRQVAFALESKNVPALKAAQKDPRFLADPLLAQFAEFSTYAPDHPAVVPTAAEIYNIIAQAVQQAVHQKASPEQALKAAASEVEPLLDV